MFKSGAALVLVMLLGCASEPVQITASPTADVSTQSQATPTAAPAATPAPLATTKPRKEIPPPNKVLSPYEEAVANGSAPPNPKFIRLMEILAKWGVEGVGLDFEDDATLDLLIAVFSDPRVTRHDILLLYTGLQMSYDKRHKSLTVGGLTQKNQVVAYILKKVPKRKGPVRRRVFKPQVPIFTPTPLPTPLPSAIPTPVVTPDPTPQTVPQAAPQVTPQEPPQGAPMATPVPEEPAIELAPTPETPAESSEGY